MRVRSSATLLSGKETSRSRSQRTSRMRLLQQNCVAKLPAGGPSGIVPGHALADVSLGEQAHVCPHLIVEIAIRLSIAEQPSEFRNEDLETGDHGYPSPCKRSTRPMTPEMRSQ